VVLVVAGVEAIERAAYSGISPAGVVGGGCVVSAPLGEKDTDDGGMRERDRPATWRRMLCVQCWIVRARQVG
jgi:hypothetical protein